jgi:hypothetical protein
MDPLTIASLIAEVLTSLGLIVGGISLGFGMALRAWSRRWIAAEGLIVRMGEDLVVRWYDAAGEIQESSLHDDGGLEPGDVPLWFHARNPARLRLDSPDHDGKALRIIGLTMLTVGLIAGIAGIVFLFL